MSDTPYIALYSLRSLDVSARVGAAFTQTWQAMERCPLVEIIAFREAQLNHPACLGWTGFLTEAKERAIAERARVPVVNFSNRHGPVAGCANVLFDEAAIGTLAADHLIEKGFRSFASIGHPRHVYGRERAEGFRSRLEEAGQTVQTLEWDELDPGRNPLEAKKDARAWVARFLDKLNGPTGILAANDGIASRILRFASEVSPERLPWLGVVGVDNTSLAEGSANHGAFTSIEPPVEVMGQTMARVLAEALDKGIAGTPVIRVVGARIIERASTGAPVSGDLFLARLTRRIHEEIEKGGCSSVDELARSFGVTPRALLARFSRKTGQSLRDHILRERLRRAATLLSDTSMSIAAIAYASGFSKHAALTEHFHKAHGMTPTAYRAECRSGKG